MKLNYRILVSLFILLMCGCSSGFQFIPQDGKAYESRTPGIKVKVLYDSPQEEYEVIGSYELEHYSPGWSKPTVHDAIPEVKAEVSRVGGDAFVVRNSYPVKKPFNDGCILISGDVIRYKAKQ